MEWSNAVAENPCDLAQRNIFREMSLAFVFRWSRR